MDCSQCLSLGIHTPKTGKQKKGYLNETPILSFGTPYIFMDVYCQIAISVSGLSENALKGNVSRKRKVNLMSRFLPHPLKQKPLRQ